MTTANNEIHLRLTIAQLRIALHAAMRVHSQDALAGNPHRCIHSAGGACPSWRVCAATHKTNAGSEHAPDSGAWIDHVSHEGAPADVCDMTSARLDLYSKDQLPAFIDHQKFQTPRGLEFVSNHLTAKVFRFLPSRSVIRQIKRSVFYGVHMEKISWHQCSFAAAICR